MKTTQRNLKAILLAIVVGWASSAAMSQPRPSDDRAGEYFTIRVIDRQTGRGVPLVELRTTNSIRLFTDSHGMVAFREPGLMDREVFFFVESHGYEVPKDGFGYRGVRLKTTPGKEAIVAIDRLNIAERLYRVTGQGIYRDSILLGRPVPLQNPVLNGQVMGQDSVDTCIYHDRLFWIWGDTGRPSYPLGHFATAGAVSDLPGRGGLDPALGVHLEYLVGPDGFSRPICRLKEPGLVWLDGLLTVKDNTGRERMLARFGRLKDLGHTLERGIVAFNDATQSFEPVFRTDPNGLPYPDFGHAFRVTAEGREYYYFALPFPLTVRLRVEAKWDSVIDPNRYEVLTALKTEDGGRKTDDRGQTTEDSEKKAEDRRSEAPTAYSLQSTASSVCRWIRFDTLVGKDPGRRAQVTASLQREKKATHFYDVESGQQITPHGGSIYYNAHRRKWIAIVLQAGGARSYLGEVWYAEADTPVGPWAYARKVVTHNKYSFYNPKQHPYFDQDAGRTIYFEGTYSWTFSGSEERATPRYDYNQIMYRLNLDDPRLVLPAPVYQVREKQERTKEGEKVRTGEGRSVSPSDLLTFSPSQLLRGDVVARTDNWDAVEAVAFYAVEPNRIAEGLVPVYTQRTSTGAVRLMTRPEASATPLFLALPAIGGRSVNSRVVPLHEYYHADSGQYLYSTDSDLKAAGVERTEKPVCRVWQAPPGPLLLDRAAKPTQAN